MELFLTWTKPRIIWHVDRCFFHPAVLKSCHQLTVYFGRREAGRSLLSAHSNPQLDMIHGFYGCCTCLMSTMCLCVCVRAMTAVQMCGNVFVNCVTIYTHNYTYVCIKYRIYRIFSLCIYIYIYYVYTCCQIIFFTYTAYAIKKNVRQCHVMSCNVCTIYNHPFGPFGILEQKSNLESCE